MKNRIANSIKELLLIFILSSILSGVGSSYASENKLPELAKKAQEAFVFIAGGSGAIISTDGYIITNNHVVGGGSSFGVALEDGRQFKARVVGRDKRGDLALLKIENARNLPHYNLGDSTTIRVGEKCLVIGNPLSLGQNDKKPSFSAGVISAVHQFRKGYNDAIVVDAPINPGNSGGPLLNMKGELIGINGMTQTRMGLRSNTGMGYAIPSSQIEIWLPFLKAAEGGNVFHGRISGFELLEGDGILLVESVSPGSDAGASGFRSGDTILELMGEHVTNLARFSSIQGAYPAGTTMSARVKGSNGIERKLLFELSPLRPWRQSFMLARPKSGDKYPVVSKVLGGTTAYNAGLREGDQITSINNSPVRVQAINQVSKYFSNLCAGDVINLHVERAGSRIGIIFNAE